MRNFTYLARSLLCYVAQLDGMASAIFTKL